MRTSTRKLLRRRGIIATSTRLALLLFQAGPAAGLCLAHGPNRRRVDLPHDRDCRFHHPAHVLWPVHGRERGLQHRARDRSAQSPARSRRAIPRPTPLSPRPVCPATRPDEGSSRRITNTATGTPGVTLPYGPNDSLFTTLDSLEPRMVTASSATSPSGARSSLARTSRLPVTDRRTSTSRFTASAEQRW